MTLVENDIRPDELFQEYLRRVSEDAQKYFLNAPKQDLPCPACGQAGQKPEFTKWGFEFVSCPDCASLYQSPRPAREVFFDYYKDSPSVRFWANEFLPRVQDARREHLFAPKARQVAELCGRDGFSPSCVVDVGAGYGLFLEEWRKIRPDARAVALEPNGDQADVCRAKGFEVVQRFSEEAVEFAGQADLAISFEVLEHTYEPLDFCRSVRKLLKTGGKALFTTLCSSGFDIQVLWEESRSISPPQHLNFMTADGVKTLMERAGFSRVEVFTPGKLDVDIVMNAHERGEIPGSDRFVRTLLKGDPAVRQAFQSFLSENRLSSHCWVWASND